MLRVIQIVLFEYLLLLTQKRSSLKICLSLVDAVQHGCDFNNGEIAAKLYLSEGTVRNHVTAIFTKLGDTSRTQAAVIAIQHGLGAE